MIESLQDVSENIKECSMCFALDTHSPCKICTNSTRDREILCVVADVIDMWAIERTGSFNGVYHVLGGILSAVSGYNPSVLKFDQLFDRVRGGAFKEIIIALNPTIDGQTTVIYLTNELKKYPAKITTLANGIPIGGELDYVDNGTIKMAFSKRWEIAS